MERKAMLIFLEMLDSDEERLSFQEVYEKNYMKMFYTALNMVKNGHMAEDAVHEAFLKLAEKYSEYVSYSEERMSSLCLIMTKQRVIDMLRKDKNIDLKDINDYDRELISEEKVIDSIVLNEEREAIRRGVKKLTETSRNVLELKYYNGLDNSEISKILGITKKHVEVRLNRAREALKKVMEKEDI